MAVQKITPIRWFDGQAEQTAKFYLWIASNTQIERILKTGTTGPGPPVRVCTID